MEQWRKNLYTMMTTQICCMIGFGLVSPFIAFYFQEMGMEMGAELDLAVSLANTLPAVGSHGAGGQCAAVSSASSASGLFYGNCDGFYGFRIGEYPGRTYERFSGNAVRV